MEDDCGQTDSCEVVVRKIEAGLGLWQIARSQGLSHSTVSDYVARAQAPGIA